MGFFGEKPGFSIEKPGFFDLLGIKSARRDSSSVPYYKGALLLIRSREVRNSLLLNINEFQSPPLPR